MSTVNEVGLPTPELNPADQALVSQFRGLIESPKTVEPELQEFLERNPRFLRLEFLRGHQLHFDLIISKFQVGHMKTDLAYLTKDSDQWTLVLVELENTTKKLLRDDDFHTPYAELTSARAQVDAWRSFVRDNASNLLSSLKSIRQPCGYNSIDYKYVPIIGRDEGLGPQEQARSALATYGGADFRILTYDSLLRHFISFGHSRRTPNILVHSRDRYRMKHMHHLPESAFGYLSPSDLELTEDQKTQLKAAGYSMDAWSAGKLLAGKGKMTSKEFMNGLGGSNDQGSGDK